MRCIGDMGCMGNLGVTGSICGLGSIRGLSESVWGGMGAQGIHGEVWGWKMGPGVCGGREWGYMGSVGESMGVCGGPRGSV